MGWSPYGNHPVTSQREIIITHQPKNIYIYICIYTFIIASNYFHIFIYNPSHYISIIFHMFHMFISSLPKMVVPRNHLIFWCLIIKQPFQETSKYNQYIYIVIILSINTYNIIISHISIYISYHIISYPGLVVSTPLKNVWNHQPDFNIFLHSFRIGRFTSHRLLGHAAARLKKIIWINGSFAKDWEHPSVAYPHLDLSDVFTCPSA